MATYDLNDQDKIDGVKSWWEKYGTMIVITAAIFVATTVGIKSWDYYHSEQRAQAADLYILLQQVQEEGDIGRINDAAYLLTKSFPSSGYAVRAALIAAHANFAANDIKTAKEKLQWVLDNTNEKELKDLTRLRMAGMLLDEGKHNKALQLLTSKHGETFIGLYADRKGDVLVATEKIKAAQRAYQTAIKHLQKNNGYYNIVRMKLDALGKINP